MIFSINFLKFLHNQYTWKFFKNISKIFSTSIMVWNSRKTPKVTLTACWDFFYWNQLSMFGRRIITSANCAVDRIVAQFVSVFSWIPEPNILKCLEYYYGWSIITRPNCALDRRGVCLYVPGFLRLIYKYAKKKEQKKNRKSVLFEESACS